MSYACPITTVAEVLCFSTRTEREWFHDPHPRSVGSRAIGAIHHGTQEGEARPPGSQFQQLGQHSGIYVFQELTHHPGGLGGGRPRQIPEDQLRVPELLEALEVFGGQLDFALAISDIQMIDRPGDAAEESKGVGETRIGILSTQHLNCGHGSSRSYGIHPPHEPLTPLSRLHVVVILDRAEKELAAHVPGKSQEALSKLKILMEQALLGHVFQSTHQRPSLAVRPAEAITHDSQHRVNSFMHVSVCGEFSRFLDHSLERSWTRI